MRFSDVVLLIALLVLCAFLLGVWDGSIRILNPWERL
jgi:hypothetical protein